MQTSAASVPILASFFGRWEIVVIVSVVLILFGFKRFPDFIRGLRQGIWEFRKASRGALWGLDRQAGDAGRSLGGIHGKLAAEALTTDNQTVEIYDPAALRDRKRAAGGAKKGGKTRLPLWRAATRCAVLPVLAGAAVMNRTLTFLVQRWLKRPKKQAGL